MKVQAKWIRLQTHVDVVVPDEYELHDFSITDEGIISFEGELMFQ